MHEHFEWSNLFQILTYQADNTDLFQPLITFFVSAFTDSYKVLYSIFGVVLGYFFSRNLTFISRSNQYRGYLLGLSLIFLFSFQIHLGMALNGVRMWTAAHILVFGLISIFYLEKTSGRCFVILTIFVHYSFFLPAILVLLFSTFKKQVPAKLYLIFFIGSFFFTRVDLATGRAIVAYLPDAISTSASSYVNEVHEEHAYGEAVNANQNKHWSVSAGSYSRTILVLIFTYLGFFRSKLIGTGRLEYLFYYGLLLYGFSNLLSDIPSAGRFFKIAELILFFVGARLFFDNQLRRINIPLLSAFVVTLALLASLFPLRMFLNYPSFWLLVGNPITLIFSSETDSIYGLLGL
jgi:hypothetical protein